MYWKLCVRVLSVDYIEIFSIGRFQKILYRMDRTLKGVVCTLHSYPNTFKLYIGLNISRNQVLNSNSRDQCHLLIYHDVAQIAESSGHVSVH